MLIPYSINRINYLKLLILFFIIICFSNCIITQKIPVEKQAVVAFYNVENLYDTIDNHHVADNDFTPFGKKNWNTPKYIEKLNHIGIVISSMDKSGFPVFVGLCEIENRKVLEDLVMAGPLTGAGYSIIHNESNDPRGIDIAALYLPDKFKVLDQHEIPIWNDGIKFSRDILYVKGVLLPADTVHFFVNHWKSRMGNQVKSESVRITAAKKLKAETDSLFKISSFTQIILMGDFNDGPADSSLNKILNAGIPDKVAPGQLYNMMYPYATRDEGSYNFKNKWIMLDNIIVSGGLFTLKDYYVTPEDAYIFKPDWLLKDNPKAGEGIPYRTWIGNNYTGGYSDHLPVFIKLIRQ